MPYRLLNIGQLLFLLPNPEFKQKVRILEKLNKRFINAKIGIIFNRTCLIEGLYIFINIYNQYIYINAKIIPIYIYIYIVRLKESNNYLRIIITLITVISKCIPKFMNKKTMQ